MTERHAGSIRVQSEEAIRRIYLNFPIKQREVMNIDMQYRILLAEDDPNLGMVLKDFELHGHTVELFENGEKHGSPSKDDFDICILDVMMPLKDGFTLAKQIGEVDYRIPSFS